MGAPKLYAVRRLRRGSIISAETPPLPPRARDYEEARDCAWGPKPKSAFQRRREARTRTWGPIFPGGGHSTTRTARIPDGMRTTARENDVRRR